jgi:hypothetical protein
MQDWPMKPYLLVNRGRGGPKKFLQLSVSEKSQTRNRYTVGYFDTLILSHCFVMDKSDHPVLTGLFSRL